MLCEWIYKKRDLQTSKRMTMSSINGHERSLYYALFFLWLLYFLCKIYFRRYGCDYLINYIWINTRFEFRMILPTIDLNVMCNHHLRNYTKRQCVSYLRIWGNVCRIWANRITLFCTYFFYFPPPLNWKQVLLKPQNISFYLNKKCGWTSP